MRHVKRLSALAVGLGLGAAVASTGTASADDFQISIDGFDLFPTAGNTATAISGMGDIAIAYGDDADASAVGGFGDDAYAGAGATAVAGDLNTGATGNNFDFASATGGGSEAVAGNGGAPDTTGSSFDFASANGVLSFAVAGQNGSGDVASAVGPVSALSGGSNNATDPANFDYASALDTTNTTSALGTQAVAGGGFSDLGGSNDTAFVIDPSGTVGSTADAGLGFNSDLAAAFGDAFNAIATGADNLFNILGLS